MDKKTKIWFADIEAYSYKYYQKYGDIKGYAFLQKDLKGNYIFNVDMKEFFDEIFKVEGQNHKIYYHNGGGYDFKFFLSHLRKRADANKTHTFTFFQKDTIIYNMTYSIKIEEYVRDKDNKLIWEGKRNKNGKKIYKRKRYTKSFTFVDTYRLWPLPLAALGDAVGMKKLDYEEYDILTLFRTNDDYINWKDGKAYKYLHRDVDIMIKFYKKTKPIYDIDKESTIAGSSYKEMIKMCSKLRNNRMWMKNIRYWKPIKTAFTGGFTWVNPKYQLKEVNNIYKYDVNSLYPYIMRERPLPYGAPIFKESNNDNLKYYQINFSQARAKSIPFMTKGHAEVAFDKFKAQWENNEEKGVESIEMEYPKILGKTENRIISNTLLKQFEKWYEIDNLEKRFIMEFKTETGMFNRYIDKWTNAKIKYEKEPALRLIAKLKQNSTYGRFAMGIEMNKGYVEPLYKVLSDDKYNVRVCEKITWVNGKTAKILNDGYINFKETLEMKKLNFTDFMTGKEMEIHDLSYIPIAEQITTFARMKMLEHVLPRPDIMVYGDTDSIHTKVPMEKYLEINPTKLGAWKFEGLVERAVYRRPKHYLNINIKIGDYTKDYDLKGGGFNVSHFNKTKEITLEQYKQKEFTIKDGKKTKIEIYGKPIIVGTEYKFSMPSWFKNVKK